MQLIHRIRSAIYVMGFLALFLSQVMANEIVMEQNKILMTNEGLFLNIDGNLTQAESVTYLGNGLYKANYGHCGRCGWPVDQNGKCTNQNCNQYGPRERD